MNTLRRLVAAPTAAGTYGFTLHARNTLEAKTTNREYLFTVDGPVSLTHLLHLSPQSSPN